MDEPNMKKDKSIYDSFRGFNVIMLDEDGNEVDSGYEADLQRAIDDEEKIVSFLAGSLSDADKDAIREEMENNSLWIIRQHLHYGMYIRNLLRKQGFDYHIFVLDNMWGYWLQKALQIAPRDS